MALASLARSVRLAQAAPLAAAVHPAVAASRRAFRLGAAERKDDGPPPDRRTGPLPTDPLAPPPRPPAPPPPQMEPGQPSIIFDESYLSGPEEEGQGAVDSAVRLSPYALMAASPVRRCAATGQKLPRAYLVRLKAARIDERQLILVPEVQHSSFVPEKKGMSIWCSLHPSAVEGLSAKSGPHSWSLKNLNSALVVPSNLSEMVYNFLGKRVVQELQIVKRRFTALPRADSAAFFRPLSAAETEALHRDELPAYPDASVIAVLDTSLRQPCEPTLLCKAGSDDADTPVFPLKLSAHAPQVVSVLREVLAMERRRATVAAVAEAKAETDAAVHQRAAREGVSDYVAGTETVAGLKGRLPQAEVDAAVAGVEAHRRDEEARFVAVVVPHEGVMREPSRDIGVPLVVALLRVGLYYGIGWEGEE